MSLDLDRLGARSSAPPYKVTREATVAYARATNDENGEHLSGTLAPPLFAVVPALKTMAALKRQVVEGFTLHGEHELRLHRPIVPGMTLAIEAEVVGIRQSKAGPLVVVWSETRDQQGELLNEQYLISVAHGRRLETAVGRDAPAHRRPDGLGKDALLAELSYPVDEDQTRRYAEASGDRDPYTFDHAEARARGLPGAIVHGLCTMAFVARAVVARCCDGDSRRLKRLAVRFSGLLLLEPGQRLTTRLWGAGSNEGRVVVIAESDDREGQSVIRHGCAEIGT